ncbi:Uncharacterized protein BM_BM951 [Brugia malayi]|uniref:Pept_C1 domain-containing protein n=1 Tax=Brugia malayi TaxID=6279 RepID=A0A4E9F1P4_BRUMA|nr:Uncharacterized protein BM_BM951 [Brugia malayi]VIO89976.1 Uncharacterized protein BM_BM951 [Brugia malayi]
MVISAKDNEETTPIAQESEKFCPAGNSNDVIISLELSDISPRTVKLTKKRKLIECCKAEKRKAAIPVYIITGIGILLLATIIEWIGHSEEDKRYHLSIVTYVNELNTTWKAIYNRFASRGVSAKEISLLAHKKKKISQEYRLGDTVEHIKFLKSKKLHLPEQFDARLQWPLCWSVHQVANQGGCGSCWAISAASVMSDRLCIATNYSNQKQISAEDLITCCAECGGCQGSHWALSAFIYWRNHGIVTGGDYGSFEGCKPYATAPSCGSPCSFEHYRKKAAPICQKTCQPLYGLSYEEDLISSRKAYWIRAEKGSNDVHGIVQEAIGNDDPIELIKREIYLYGPILACFIAREDFQHYNSGIYQTINSTISKELYGHCAKLLGWGKEGTFKYWLYMNTWGRNWGDYGFFRVSQTELPEEAIAGLP